MSPTARRFSLAPGGTASDDRLQPPEGKISLPPAVLLSATSPLTDAFPDSFSLPLRMSLLRLVRRALKLLSPLLGWSALASAQPVVDAPHPRTIAVIRDDASWLADPLYAKIRHSLEEMTTGRTPVAFLDDARFTAGTDAGSLRQALDQALADPAIDEVLVLGVRAATLAGDPSVPLTKPVLGAVLIDSDLAPLPYDAAGHSTKPNFFVVALSARSSELLRQMQAAVPFTALQILVDDHFAAKSAELEAWRGQLARELGIDARIVPLGATAAPTLAALDPATTTVFLLPAVRQTAEEHTRLLDGLRERRLTVLSFAGQSEVEAGALSGALPEASTQLARRVAIVFDQLSPDTPATALTLRVPLRSELYFNETTAAAIGFAPKFGALATATLVSPYAPAGGQPLSLGDAIVIALEKNFALRARVAGTEISRQEVKGATGTLLPQLAAVANYQRIDRDRAQASGGLFPEKTLVAGLGLTQTIFDDEATTRIRLARAALQAATALEKVQRLDTANAAAQAYLQLLSARAALRVAEQNAKATQKHLELAHLRQRVGTSGPEDIYRFESLSAQQRSEVVAARMQVERARTALNRVLGVDATARWEVRDVALDDPAFAGLTAPITGFIDNRQSFERLRTYLTAYAANHSPDLAALEQGVVTQRLSAEQKQRRGYVPKLTAAANFGRLVEQDYGGPTIAEQLRSVGLPVPAPELDRTVWTVNLQATLPLFTGGSLTADNRKARAQLRQLEFTRDGTREAVIAQTQAGLYAIESSFSNIALSRTAADLAGRNLDVVRQKYEQGTVSIVTLLEAQNTAFAQQQAAEVALYRFLADDLQLQRLLGWIETLATPQENAAWLREVAAAVAR